tara:strand:- start:74 stop:616 length:543 start_codon:yes stop_codon:yes gene_type:complete
LTGTSAGAKKAWKTMRKRGIKRQLTGVKRTKSKSAKSSNKKTTSEKAGEKAHKETIGPSHRKCQEFLEEINPNRLVTPPTGRPDFIVHKKNLEYFELKPVKGAQDRTFLSKSQETEVRRLLKNKISVSMVYYKKSQKRKIAKFQFIIRPLTTRNLKKYCLSSNDSERIKLDRIRFPDEYF